ncbi:ADP-ribosylglycohydrolase [Bradyrhizobium japonicum USDA 38]|uniref:ADP-ribosylglycohydrolase family protein n=1 Tax=Bradyrhizobium TaxID=374 RepID=UPI0003F8F849|nr:ADP-ribosylglycohydrolase family protein [Bradyrhizobium japonicum]MCS3894068.1 ADP-ribosylglycohydrolase [Bradyrhizobium japonicum USDA 38]MCS3946582.1 ADP-ribosylglycohydrolase [Bradyrhizobium japonicum]MCW2220643.1 ADP-ribosylglycohydrolase [Bradyrhizobium japonicum]MCW2345257.1 ADP-ribosylglycohydrolase [Bradyrhizobium japonicum]WLB56518.1 ADP-ribosylglycohydrolase family protein [Bradyrhizobium japonicum]
MTAIPHDYAERVYAGVLGKLIGVYLGRPFEGWTYERIMKELGPINYYVNERRDVALRSHHLVVTDDDVSGTFAFPRALADNGFPKQLTSKQIGQAWLNYIVEERAILWWGGIGNSTEHTAYLRLKSGIPAPRSGSIELNGKTVAEQIGAQIFIDGWAMVSPGNPEQAAYLADQAGRVSHDGESVHAAKLLAAMEAQAFVERDVQKLIDTGLAFVPKDALIRRVVNDVRDWHAGDNSNDWERTRALIAERYGYDKFLGNCHVVPNHALIILATLYGESSFQEAMRIANTAGWDTDCNAGNVGCLFGIRTGLAGLDAGPDFRTPIADRMYISTADGGAAITDAVIETQSLVAAGRALAGAPAIAAKNGARFNFDFPGSLQGFHVHGGSPARLHAVELSNVSGHSRTGERSLAIDFRRLAPGRVARVATPTFFDKEVFTMPTYQLVACPTLYSGQRVECRLESDIDSGPVTVRLFASVYDEHDELVQIRGEAQAIATGSEAVLSWRVPDTHSYPIFEIGLEIETSDPRGVDGALYLDYLTWTGAPDTILKRPDDNLSTMWKHAWVNDASQFQTRWEGLRVTNGSGLGFIAQGSRDWRDYRVTSQITPLLKSAWGLAARVQGRERYYALMLDVGGRIKLVKRDHEEMILAEDRFEWELDEAYTLELRLRNTEIRAFVDGREVFSVRDEDKLWLQGGAVGLLVDTGSISTRAVQISPL